MDEWEYDSSRPDSVRAFIGLNLDIDDYVDESMNLTNESDDEVDLAFKKGVHSCAEEINNGINKMLEYYTVPSYNHQSKEFKTAFEEIIPFKNYITAILKLTES